MAITIKKEYRKKDGVDWTWRSENSTGENSQCESAAKADRPKRVTINVDGKRKTVTQETADNARYGMGEWWEKEGKFL